MTHIRSASTRISISSSHLVMVKTWRFLTILLVALLLGLAFAHVLEQPAKMRYDGALYLTLQKTLYVAWGPPNVGGFLEPAAILATLVLTFIVRARRPAVWLTTGAAVALLVAFPVVFFALVHPANAAFRDASVTSIPANWTHLRAQWELGHTIRFVLQMVAFSLLLLSVIFETHTTERA